LKATQLAGFDELSMTGPLVLQLIAEGVSPKEMLQRARDANVRLAQLDPLARWSAEWVPHNMPVEWHALFALPPERFLELMAQLEITSLTAMSSGRAGTRSIAQLTDEFAALCQAAAKQGIRVDLEFIPLDWNVPDLSTARQIVHGAKQPNSGIVFDFWHFFRSGADWETLATIPGNRISYVQMCDAGHKIPAHRSAMQDCLEDRLPLSLGELEVGRLIRALHEMGALTRVGPEYFSNHLDGMGPESIAAVSRGSMIEAYDAEGVSHSWGAAPEWRSLFRARGGSIGSAQIP
jgi:sugar phosphate isomerase/epimerase